MFDVKKAKGQFLNEAGKYNPGPLSRQLSRNFRKHLKWCIKDLLPLFNIKESEYKKFINFLQGQNIKLKSL